mgnify:CR=1 FL=1
MSEKCIVVDSIAYSYGKVNAVKGLSFDVFQGEILGFLGPNGAGKSTTIKMLIGQLVPQAGSIHILGDQVKGHSPQVHARIGVSFEEKNLYLQMSARENLRFFASLFGIKNPDVNGLLEQVGLADRAKDRVTGFSKGMRQRLMIARALVNNPSILFLDEPTDGLDPVSAKAIRQIIQQQAKKGTAVLLTTHDMHEAELLADRVAFINEGSIHAMDTPENLKLQHGSRSVKVRVRTASGIESRSIELDQAKAGEDLKLAVEGAQVVTIHTEEASLEDVFIGMVGRGL